MLFGLFDSAHTHTHTSDIIFSKQMIDPPFPLSLASPYLQYPMSVATTHIFYLLNVSVK